MKFIPPSLGNEHGGIRLPQGWHYNLMKRDMFTVNQCLMYKQYEEQVDRLMLHCCEGEYHMVFGVKLVMPNAMRGFLQVSDIVLVLLLLLLGSEI